MNAKDKEFYDIVFKNCTEKEIYEILLKKKERLIDTKKKELSLSKIKKWPSIYLRLEQETFMRQKYNMENGVPERWIV